MTNLSRQSNKVGTQVRSSKVRNCIISFDLTSLLHQLYQLTKEICYFLVKFPWGVYEKRTRSLRVHQASEKIPSQWWILFVVMINLWKAWITAFSTSLDKSSAPISSGWCNKFWIFFSNMERERSLKYCCCTSTCIRIPSESRAREIFPAGIVGGIAFRCSAKIQWKFRAHCLAICVIRGTCLRGRCIYSRWFRRYSW